MQIREVYSEPLERGMQSTKKEFMRCHGRFKHYNRNVFPSDNYKYYPNGTYYVTVVWRFLENWTKAIELTVNLRHVCMPDGK